MMFNRYLGQRTPEKDEDRLLVSLMAKGLPPAATSGGFGKIIVIHADDGGVEIFDPTEAGLTSALAAASAGDAVWLPPATIAGDHTVPAGVGVQAYGKKTDLTGTITMSASSFLQSVYIIPTVNQAGTISGLIGPSSGTAYLNDCSITATNNGAGDAYAVNQSGGGTLWVWNCHLYGNAAGGGDGYGVKQSAGTLYVTDDGRIRGSEAEFSGTVSVFSFDDVVRLKTPGGISKLYPADSIGFAAALAAASSGDVIWAPPGTISGDHTILAGVEIWGAGRDKTILTGEITLSSDSVLNNLSVIRSDNISPGTIFKGVIGGSSGSSYIFDCLVSVTNTISGEVHAIDQPTSGTLYMWGCDIQGVVGGSSNPVGRLNQVCYSIYVEDGGEVVHRFCNLRATQNSTTQRNPLFDTAGSVFTPGSTVGSGSFVVTAEAGSTISGMTVGNWYSLENTGGPWDNGDVGGDNLRYGWCISLDGGTTWDVIEILISGGTRTIWTPAGIEHTETEATNYARIYFKAAATTIKIRVADSTGAFANNGGSMGYTLKNATIELDATEAYASDIIDPLGATVPVPHLGDRAVYDVDDYDTKHASDIYNAMFQRHLPDSGNSGNIVYDDGDEWKSGTPEDAGITGGGTPTDPYWEPAVVDGGDVIMFTENGDIAMIWVS